MDGVMSALRRAASETGTDFGYLLMTAMRESSLNPAAQAASSSATGLFQFIEQTWLGTVREHGAEHGLKAYADAIEVGSNGRFKVADGALRQEILALRKNPEAAALMAGEMTGDMRSAMEGELGRGVSAGELYVAHFLGPKSATKLIRAAAESPNVSAATLFPQAAAANRSIFFGKNGEARSVASVAAALTSKHENLPAPSDTMFAEVAVPARTTPWRGATVDSTLPSVPVYSSASFVRDEALVMAPIMVQLLATLDPLPHMAAKLDDEEPMLRRTDAELI
jgi:hypothetical protein